MKQPEDYKSRLQQWVEDHIRPLGSADNEMWEAHGIPDRDIGVFGPRDVVEDWLWAYALDRSEEVLFADND